jgi:hypothetical protein
MFYSIHKYRISIIVMHVCSLETFYENILLLTMLHGVDIYARCRHLCKVRHVKNMFLLYAYKFRMTIMCLERKMD